MKKCYGRIHPVSFALAVAILWAAALFIMAMISGWSDYGDPFVQAVGSLYIDYHPGWIGGIIGAFWGFIDAFVGALFIGYLYNLFLGNRGCRCSGGGSDL